jgi:hypothetical protein
VEGLEAVFFPELCFCIGEAGGLDCFADCAENWAIAVAEVEFHNSNKSQNFKVTLHLTIAENISGHAVRKVTVNI